MSTDQLISYTSKFLELLFSHIDQITIAVVSILSYYHLLDPIKAKLQDSRFHELVKIAYNFAQWAERTGNLNGASKEQTALKKLDECLTLFEKRSLEPVDFNKARAIFTHLHEEDTKSTLTNTGSIPTPLPSKITPLFPSLPPTPTPPLEGND